MTFLCSTAVPSAYFVILGENKIYKTEWFEKTESIADIKIHESFTFFTLENDIALIQVRRPTQMFSISWYRSVSIGRGCFIQR